MSIRNSRPTGKDAAGNVVNGDETVSREDALRFYTLGSAWFSFDEDEIGSIKVGKLADLVILNKDFFRIPEEEIHSVQSHLTVVNGDIVYDATKN